MKAEDQISGPEFVLSVLKVIWEPAIKARRLQEELDVHSLAETCEAAERAGYEVHYVDLPSKVSGLATSVAGKSYIVVNRAKPRAQRQYTVSHELGHHVLHLNPRRTPSSSEFPITPSIEFEADLFAAFWVFGVTSGAERETLMRENPELSANLSLAVFLTVMTVVAALLVCALSRLFDSSCQQSEVQ